MTCISAHDGLTCSIDPVTHAVTLVREFAKIEEPIVETDELLIKMKTALGCGPAWPLAEAARRRSAKGSSFAEPSSLGVSACE